MQWLTAGAAELEEVVPELGLVAQGEAVPEPVERALEPEGLVPEPVEQERLAQVWEPVVQVALAWACPELRVAWDRVPAPTHRRVRSLKVRTRGSHRTHDR